MTTNLDKFVKIFGGLLLIVGLIAAFYGPAEIYCFYMFTKVGPFNYEGFTIGTFWFALLVVQNISYYLLAFFLIPTGIGLIKLRDWGRYLACNFLYVWIIFGFSIFISFFVSIPKFLDNLSINKIGAIGLFLFLGGIAIPFIFIKLFNSHKVVELFRSEKNTFLSKISPSILLITTLNLLLIVFFHISIFFNCLFPLFGRFIFLREGMCWLSGSILSTGILTYSFRKYKIGFWGLIIYYMLLLVSVILTFGKYSTREIIQLLNYSQYEHDKTISVLSPLFNFNLTTFFISVIVITLGLIIFSKKEFATRE